MSAACFELGALRLEPQGAVFNTIACKCLSPVCEASARKRRVAGGETARGVESS